MSATTLFVLFGGQSAEHDVSCVTAKHVLDAIRPDRYTVIPVGISRDGDWSIASIDQDADALDPAGQPTDPFTLFADAAENGVVVPLLHGPLGEDGTIQGLCELTGIAYVGAGVLGSALAIVYAAAIAFFGVAIGNSQARVMLVTAAIGLLHGLGFSFVLHEILRVESPNVWQSLLAFNLGVEIGQIAIVLAVWPLCRLCIRLSENAWLLGRRAVAILAALVAMTWAAQRALSIAAAL